MTYRDNDATLRARIAELEREKATRHRGYRFGYREDWTVGVSAVAVLIAAFDVYMIVDVQGRWAIAAWAAFGAVTVPAYLAMAFVHLADPAPPCKEPYPPVVTPPPSVFVGLSPPAPTPMAWPTITAPMPPWVPLGFATLLTITVVALSAKKTSRVRPPAPRRTSRHR